MELSALIGPFVLLLLLTFGLLMMVLGAFLMIWARGRPRVYGTGILAVGIVVLAALVGMVTSGAFLQDVDIVSDVLVPGIVHLLAIALGAVLAIVPFLVAAIRS